MVHNRNNKRNLEMEIILVLLKGNSHLREIARNITSPHVTVLRKINELAKENVLDYKKEGKNKVFFIKSNLKAKNYVYSAEIYKLNELLRNHPRLTVILEDVKKNSPNGMIILFGSYAKGSARENSDIDIYIETENNKIRNKLREIHTKLSIKTGQFDTNSLLIKEIIKSHVIIRGLEEFYGRIGFFKEA